MSIASNDAVKIVQLNEEILQNELKELVCGSVEETLNALLEKGADASHSGSEV